MDIICQNVNFCCPKKISDMIDALINGVSVTYIVLISDKMKPFTLRYIKPEDGECKMNNV